jgi:AraC-like DNA-binding protein
METGKGQAATKQARVPQRSRRLQSRRRAVPAPLACVRPGAPFAPRGQCGEYLKNLRLEKAAQAFARGNTGIMDVAMDAGFRNLSYFYREFQKKYGFTPKQFIHRCVEMPKE